MKKSLFLLVFVPAFSISAFAQPPLQITYKQLASTELLMDIYFPPELDSSQSYPAMVFFFGGGWNGGSVSQFEAHARYFSERGLICFLVDYRVNSRHGTSPFESLKDAKSAIRFIRKNASRFHVDPSKIIASGGSAGGHLAAATALVSGYNEAKEDSTVSCTPDALVLFNPVIDNGPGGYGYERIGEEYKDFSPLHNIKKAAPPTILFLGTEDKLIPVATAEYYKTVMGKVGSSCELVLFEGEGHGFFNYKNQDHYKKTIKDTGDFLISLGYLKGENLK